MNEKELKELHKELGDVNKTLIRLDTSVSELKQSFKEYAGVVKKDHNGLIKVKGRVESLESKINKVCENVDSQIEEHKNVHAVETSRGFKIKLAIIAALIAAGGGVVSSFITLVMTSFR